jgi:hypothetical protein
MIDHEDIPGAAAASRVTLAREYALRRIAAYSDDTQATYPRPTTDAEAAGIRARAVLDVERGAQYASLTLPELDAAELEIRRVYLTGSERKYLLAVARQHLTLLQTPEPYGASPDAERYRTGTTEDCPDGDDLGWPT